ncbi:hypothetical protein E2320_011532, partial [Naja naja]
MEPRVMRTTPARPSFAQNSNFIAALSKVLAYRRAQFCKTSQMSCAQAHSSASWAEDVGALLLTRGSGTLAPSLGLGCRNCARPMRPQEV